MDERQLSEYLEHETRLKRNAREFGGFVWSNIKEAFSGAKGVCEVIGLVGILIAWAICATKYPNSQATDVVGRVALVAFVAVFLFQVCLYVPYRRSKELESKLTEAKAATQKATELAAKNAEERTLKFDVKDVEGREQLIKTAKELTEARQKIHTLDMDLIAAQKAVSDANARIARTEKFQEPWGMTQQQLDLLSSRMALFKPDSEQPGLITCVLGDPASAEFAAKLVSAFRKAGWNLPGTGYGQAIFSGLVQGLIVKVRSQHEIASAVPAFIEVSRAAGIEPVGRLDPSIPARQFRIVVGSKPTHAAFVSS